MTTVISHDPFARFSVIRESELHRGTKTCQWCGNQGKQTKTGKYRLFRYGTEDDSIHARRGFFSGLFCSLACAKIYHNF